MPHIKARRLHARQARTVGLLDEETQDTVLDKEMQDTILRPCGEAFELCFRSLGLRPMKVRWVAKILAGRLGDML